MRYLYSLLVLLVICSTQVKADNNPSFGFGIGTLYSGVGINLAWQSKTDMKYISAGCAGYSSNQNFHECGAGFGWVTTDIFGDSDNNHGLGFWLGTQGDTSFYNRNTMRREDENLIGVGLGYHYFSNGIDKSGMNFGAGFIYSEAGALDRTQFWLNIGYQF